MTPNERRNVEQYAREVRCKCGLRYAECYRCNPSPLVPDVPAVDGPRVISHQRKDGTHGP